MKDWNQTKSKLSWSNALVRKWFKIKNKACDFYADAAAGRSGDGEHKNSIPERDSFALKKNRTERLYKRNSDHTGRRKDDIETAQVTNIQDYRLFVATWNVGGKSPPSHLNFDDWIYSSPPADIYVFGFQEIVPLNASSVLGAEDNGPALKWVALIGKILNNFPGNVSCNGSCAMSCPLPDPPVVELNDDFEGSSMRWRNMAFLRRRSFQSSSHSMRIEGDLLAPQRHLDRRSSVCDRVLFGSKPSGYDPNYIWGWSSDDDNGDDEVPDMESCSPMSSGYSTCQILEERDKQSGSHGYCLVASKKMVGIFLTVWTRSEIRDSVKNLKVSCVGRGLMGYLGNKGSISISVSIHQTTFCFICSHLTSGQKDGDELRRNSDVMEILRKTRFPKVHGQGGERSPETIFEHDRIIWLGDLNYRIALSYSSTKALVEMHNWKALLEKDQLKMEQSRGRTFVGWKEGPIYFPPTYKYSKNSDKYAGDDLKPKEKRRTPAWCDRVLWHGRGLTQLSYFRGESRFSDHRPVCSIFMAEVESTFRRSWFTSSRIETGELLTCSYPYGY